MVGGLRVREIPCLWGKALNQKTLMKTISTIILGGVRIKTGYVVSAASAFLDSADALFNFGNVLIFAGNI
jgi:hypothetical protein